MSACGKQNDIPEMIYKNKNVDNSGENFTDISEAETSSPDTTETQPQTLNSKSSSANSAAGTSSAPSNKPTGNSQTQSESKPAASELPSNPGSQPPASSAPPAPDYEILGSDYSNGVLKGLNGQRAALGFPDAKLDSALSVECLVQAKRMAEVGYDFHSDHPTGCEGTAKVPYNFPAELMGEMMCNHVAGFTYAATIKIGVAVVRSGNSLYAVVQGTA